MAEEAREVEGVNFLGEDTDNDIRSLNDYSDGGTAQESIQNLDRADYFNVPVDDYNVTKSELDKEYETSKRTPAQIHPTVKNYMAENKDQTNAVKEDVGIWDKVGRIADHIQYNLFTSGDLDDPISELTDLDISGEITEEEELELDRLVNERNEIQAQFADLSAGEKLLGNAGKVITDMVDGIMDHKAVIAGSTAIGAGVGATGGTVALPVIGTIAGAGGGASTGFGTGVATALGLHAYNQTVNDMWLTLKDLKDDEGNPIELSRDERLNISRTVGATAGTLEFFTGKALGKGISAIARKQIIAEIIKSPSKRAVMNTVGAMVSSASVSGAEEIAAEMAIIGGEEYAKSKEGGFVDNFFNTLGKPETQERLFETGLTGAFAGGAIPGTVGTLTHKTNVKKIEENNQRVERLAKKFDIPAEELSDVLKNFQEREGVLKGVDDILTTQKQLNAISELSKETKLGQLSPEQSKKMTQQILSEAKINNVVITQSDIEIIESANPELAQLIKENDVNQALISESNYTIESHEFLELVKEHPTVAEYMRLNPEGPNPLESKNFLERLSKSEEKRTELFNKLNVGEELSQEDVNLMKSLNEDVKDFVNDVGQKGYETSSKPFTEEVEGVVPDKKAESFRQAQEEARIEISNQIESDFDTKEQRIEDRVVRANEKIQKRLELQQDAKEIKLTTAFKPVKGVVQANHKRKNFSPLAIDPKFLPEDLREAYLDDPKLKKNKAFVEGGITPQESAALAGFGDDWQGMLKTLANSKTLKERVEARKLQSQQLRQQVIETRSKSYDERLDKVFDNDNRLHLKEMKFLREKKWPATKTGINLVTLPLPRIQTLKNSAANIIRKTKVGNLSVTQYNQGAKSNQRKANNFILSNKPNEAFQAKEKVILNNELTRESLKVRRDIRTAKDFIKTLTSRKNEANLKKSGYDQHVNDILDLFNLNENKAKAENQESFLKHLLETGKDIIIPDHLADIRERGDNLTTEQFLAITDHLKSLNHQSKHMNKLLRMQDAIETKNQVLSEEALVSDLASDLETHHLDYDEKRLRKIRNRNSMSFKDHTFEFIGTINASLNNPKNIALQLDREQLNGKHNEAILGKMVESESKSRNLNSDVMNQIKKIADDYGQEKFDRAFNEFVDVPEFKGFLALGDGKIQKSDLWTLLMYMGDPDSKARIKNFVNESGDFMSLDTMQFILDTHLDESDAKLAQNFTNIFKSFEKESFDLHKRTTGVEPKMITGVPVIHRGRVTEGGYVPNNFLKTSADESITRFIEVMGDKVSGMFGGKSDNKLYSKLRAAEQTEQGRFISRKKNTTRELDTNFRNIISAYEETIHDLSYRESGMDTLKLLRNPVYAKSIQATVGEAKYNTMVNSVIEVVGKDSDIFLDNETMSTLSKGFNHLKTGQVVGLLGFNPSSILMQPLSLSAATLRMGNTGGKYLAKSLSQTLKHVGTADYQKLWDEAVLINPDIKLNRDAVDDSLTATMSDVLPKKGNKLSRARDWVTETSLLGLKHLDVHIKVAVSNAAYTQFVNGDVKGFNRDKLNSMSQEDINLQAKKYVKQISDLALTTSATIDKSALEKVAAMKLFTMFYTDVRSQLLTGFSQTRKIKQSLKLQDYGQAMKDTTSMIMVMSLANMYQEAVYRTVNPGREIDDETPWDEMKNVEDLGTLMTFLGSTASYGLKSAIEAPLGSIPLVRDIKFATQGFKQDKTARTLGAKFITDVANGLVGAGALLTGDGLTRKQFQGLWYTAAGAAGGGIPVNGPRKINNMLKGYADIDLTSIPSTLSIMTDDVLDKIDNAKEDASPEKLQTLEGLEDEVSNALPRDMKSVEITADMIDKQALSKPFELNETTGAAGIYQFTEERWNELAERYPDLELTDDGRISSDTSEQDLAMYQSMKENGEVLQEYSVPVNDRTLFGSHRFGALEYTAIHLSKSSEKLNDLGLEGKLFDGFTTVKQVKDFINKEMD